ncbi:MAG: hypothetical protein E7056_05845 [Lentisphaerae bacterium]|nr:hypothetical protein [Lentisphaerota bacterium]
MKINKKKCLIHGALLAAMIIACCIDFQLIIFWNLGYAIYFMGRIVIKVSQDLHPPILKILTIAVMLAGSAPCIGLMCIPGWLICVAHSIHNPETGENLPTYNGRGILLQNAAFYRDYNNYFFEGDIKESALKQVAVLQNWQLEEITTPATLQTAKTLIAAHYNQSAPDFIKVENGLMFSSYNGSDCGETVIYDRQAERLYFSATLR